MKDYFRSNDGVDLPAAVATAAGLLFVLVYAVALCAKKKKKDKDNLDSSAPNVRPGRLLPRPGRVILDGEHGCSSVVCAAASKPPNLCGSLRRPWRPPGLSVFGQGVRCTGPAVPRVCVLRVWCGASAKSEAKKEESRPLQKGRLSFFLPSLHARAIAERRQR